MIEVTSRARLHLGLLDNNGEQGRLYGSIGLAVTKPQLVLTAEKADGLTVDGLEAQRAATYARRFFRRYGLPEAAYINVKAGIPPHVGLGSGTQLALAVGTALARLTGLQLKTPEIAVAVERGIHSGIGISTFRYGGFVLDGGHRIQQDVDPDHADAGRLRQVEKNSVPPLLFRHPMPKDWIFVTVIPSTDQGFSGEAEKVAFQKLPKAPSSLVEKISRVLLIKMLPALVEKDIENFGRALTSIQFMVGDCFASVQGGRFANPVCEKVVSFLLSKGAAGIGQSSWGPTVYGLVKGRETARSLAGDVARFLQGVGGGSTFCGQPHNRGARIREL